MLSEEKLLDNEKREQAAFDNIAEGTERESLITSDWTFERYRSATNQRPVFDSYPDLLFVDIGQLVRRSEPYNTEKPLTGVRVLDLGAGDGIWSVILADQGAQVSSIEISPKQVELARTRMRNHHLRWEAITGSAFRLNDEFKNDSFDLVFGPAVLHHLTADLPTVFSGVHAILKPGGIAIFTEPFAGAKWLRSVRLHLSGLFPLDSESPDERPLSSSDLQPLLETFSTVSITYRDVTEKLFRRLRVHRNILQLAVSIDRVILKVRLFERLATSVVLVAKK